MRRIAKRGKLAKTVGERVPAPGLIVLADVIAIPTSRGFAYARAFESVALGILNLVPTKECLTLDDIKSANCGVAFFVEYCEPIDHPDWIYLGNWKFESEEASQAPAVYIEDCISPGDFRILQNGRMRNASKEEIQGLNKHVLLFPRHVRKKIEEHFSEEGSPNPEGPERTNGPSLVTNEDSATYFPFILSDASGPEGEDYRLVFADWEWLHQKFGSDTISGLYLNGTGLESLVKASRLENHLPLAEDRINYNSEGDTCYIQFSRFEDACATARIAREVLQDPILMEAAIRRIKAENLDE